MNKKRKISKKVKVIVVAAAVAISGLIGYNIYNNPSEAENTFEDVVEKGLQDNKTIPEIAEEIVKEEVEDAERNIGKDFNISDTTVDAVTNATDNVVEGVSDTRDKE